MGDDNATKRQNLLKPYQVNAALMARARNPSLRIAVTGANEPRCALLRRAGASEVVTPDELIAGALVDLLGKGA